MLRTVLEPTFMVVFCILTAFAASDVDTHDILNPAPRRDDAWKSQAPSPAFLPSLKKRDDPSIRLSVTVASLRSSTIDQVTAIPDELTRSERAIAQFQVPNVMNALQLGEPYSAMGAALGEATAESDPECTNTAVAEIANFREIRPNLFLHIDSEIIGEGGGIRELAGGRQANTIIQIEGANNGATLAQIIRRRIRLGDIGGVISLRADPNTEEGLDIYWIIGTYNNFCQLINTPAVPRRPNQLELPDALPGALPDPDGCPGRGCGFITLATHSSGPRSH